MGVSATVPAAPTPNVAVIAVHGVAYHAAGASANAMADLLLSLPTAPAGAVRWYSSFDSQTIHLPLQPTRLEKKAAAPARTRIDKIFAFLQERSVNFATLLDNWTSQRGRPGEEWLGTNSCGCCCRITSEAPTATPTSPRGWQDSVPRMRRGAKRMYTCMRHTGPIWRGPRTHCSAFFRRYFSSCSTSAV